MVSLLSYWVIITLHYHATIALVGTIPKHDNMQEQSQKTQVNLQQVGAFAVWFTGCRSRRYYLYEQLPSSSHVGYLEHNKQCKGHFEPNAHCTASPTCYWSCLEAAFRGLSVSRACYQRPPSKFQEELLLVFKARNVEIYKTTWMIVTRLKQTPSELIRYELLPTNFLDVPCPSQVIWDWYLAETWAMWIHGSIESTRTSSPWLLNQYSITVPRRETKSMINCVYSNKG